MEEEQKWVFPHNTKELMEDYWFLRAEGVSALIVQEVLKLAYPGAEIFGLQEWTRRRYNNYSMSPMFDIR